MLHLKHRPSVWEEVIGNEVVKKSISNLEINTPILFEGSHGLGKTTLAYIRAKEFAKLESIRDMNCVHFSKIDDMRETLSEFINSSLFGNKVLILDEIHELSDKSQQILLKYLENLPKYCLILACTTTTKKVLNTLLERFIRYTLSKLSSKESLYLINYVSKSEDIHLPKPIIAILLDSSEGIPRRLLVNLNKLRNISDESEAKYLLDISNLEEDPDTLTLFRLICSAPIWEKVKIQLSILLQSKNPEDIRRSLLNLICGRVMSKYCPDNDTMVSLYNTLISSSHFMEKTNLIMAIYAYCLDLKEK